MQVSGGQLQNAARSLERLLRDLSTVVSNKGPENDAQLFDEYPYCAYETSIIHV